MPVAKRQHAGLFDDDSTDFTFDDSFLKKPKGAIFQQWKAALLFDPTQSVAKMVVDGTYSSGHSDEKMLLKACCFVAALVNKY